MRIYLFSIAAVAVFLCAQPLVAYETTCAAPYASWTNGPSDDPGYFPISVWLQDPADAGIYKAAGVNLYIALWQGPTLDQLETLRSAGMQTFADQNAIALGYDGTLSDGRPVIAGWYLSDEPDNVPQVPPSEIMTRYQTWRANDPTRPINLGLSQGIGWDSGTWVGQGGLIDPETDYPAYIAASDVIAFDIYPMASLRPGISRDAWRQALGIDRLIEYSPPEGRVVWNVIETGNIFAAVPDRRATQEEIRAEVWMSIIHGSRGLSYFIHGKTSFSDFDPRALLRPENAETFAAISDINGEVHELAPLINCDPVDGLISQSDVAGSSPVDYTVRTLDDRVFVFAVGMRESVTIKRFALLNGTADFMVRVLGENRSILSNAGSFEDVFDGYDAHLYELIPAPEPGSVSGLVIGFIGLIAVGGHRRGRDWPAHALDDH